MPQTTNNKVRLNVNISSALSNTLDALAEQEQTNKSDILRKAIALFEVVVKAKEDGAKLIIVDEKENIKKEIIGL